jgi:hypothetical protein
VLVQPYTNPVTTSPPAAFNTPVFGCQANRYLPATNVCDAHSVTIDADTLVVNYYSNDASGLDIGNRADCLRQDSANDVVINITRRNAGHASATTANRPFLMPISPLFVSNRYTLTPAAMNVEGAAISTFGLACHGNGGMVASPNYNYYPIIAGIDQLRFYFLERTNETAVSQFRRANGVTNWANVVAVRVCLMARSLQSARLQGSTSYTIADCDATARSFTDGIERRVFSQTFALKNHSQLLNP